MLNKFKDFLKKPELYTPSTGKFWDDAYISEQMLQAHLNPERDAASRRHNFIEQSVGWISQIAPPAAYMALLDIGCGPGLYTERFYKAGYFVTGMDFSKRSIAYAREHAAIYESDVQYICQDYLTMDYVEQFDVITLIYCDYGALSFSDRQLLTAKVYKALKPGGKFILDVFKPNMRNSEKQTWQYFAHGGFYTQEPHLCLESVYQYDDDDRTELRQFIVLTESAINCYNIWDHFFSQDKLTKEILSAGFREHTIYGDVAGTACAEEQETLCGVFSK